jgi:hypothetical protein
MLFASAIAATVSPAASLAGMVPLVTGAEEGAFAFSVVASMLVKGIRLRDAEVGGVFATVEATRR